jgi:N-methylhydantoinase A
VRRFGYQRTGSIVLVSISSTAVGRVHHLAATSHVNVRRGAEPMRRRVVFGEGPREATILRRDGLMAGVPLDGPAVIEQLDSTTLLPPGSSATASEDGSIVVRILRGDGEKAVA